MLVEFTRVAVTPSQPPAGSLEGEDDGLPVSVTVDVSPLPLSVNAVFVPAVTPSSQNPEITIIKLSDGRGYAVRESYRDALRKLEGAPVLSLAH